MTTERTWAMPPDRASTWALTHEPMRRKHLKAVLPIEQAAYPKSWSRRVFEDELAQVKQGTRYYVIARWGKQIVGFAGLWFVDDPDGRQAHITNIVVDEDYRRQGIATFLLLHLAEAALANSCVSWTLEVRETSQGAQDLYHRFGFAPVGVRKRYYENSIDAVVMWCHGIDTDEYAQRLEDIACRSSNPS